MELIRRLVKPGNTVLDIGANIGFYGRFFSDCVGPSGHVYCFEPDTGNFIHLKKEMHDKINATLIQKAIASETGMLTFYLSGLLNVDHRSYEPESYSSKKNIEKISIDDFVEKRFKVDFIKMDIQGFETVALKGMKRTIDANPGLVILTEFWPHGLLSAGSSPLEMYDLAVQLGFTISVVNGQSINQLSREEAGSFKVEYFADADLLLHKNNIL